MNVEVDKTSAIDNLIINTYHEYMKHNPIIPSAKHISDMADYVMDVMCYDLAYPEISKSMITDDVVHDVLSRYRYVHKHEGDLYFDAQNKIFENWFYHEQLLKEGK
jgi:hypothetical protein